MLKLRPKFYIYKMVLSLAEWIFRYKDIQSLFFCGNIDDLCI